MPNRITEARKYAGLTQRELAAQMGLKPSTVSGYESGTYDPKSDGLAKIATICGVTVDFLLGLTDEPTGQFSPVISDQDPQIEQLLALAGRFNAQGLQKLIDYAEDLAESQKYLK